MSSNQTNELDNNSQNNNSQNNNSQELTHQQVNVDETLPMAFPVSGNATYASVPVAQTSNQSSSQYPGGTTESTIQYVPPVFTISDTNEHIQDITVTEPMVISYQYGKAVRCLTLVDMFFGILHVFVSPIGIINIIFPFLGYKGASTYNKCFVDSYLVYQILFCFFNILILLNVLFNESVKLPEGQTTEGVTAFQILNILLNFYFIRIITRLSSSIAKITDQQKTILMHLIFQNTGGVYY